MRKIVISILFFMIFIACLSKETDQKLQRMRTFKIQDQESAKAKADSLPNYSIQIRGKENRISITKDISKNGSDTLKSLNKMEIDGEYNTVNITQNENENKVEVKQSGKGNQVNIVQKNR